MLRFAFRGCARKNDLLTKCGNAKKSYINHIAFPDSRSRENLFALSKSIICINILFRKRKADAREREKNEDDEWVVYARNVDAGLKINL